MPRLPSVLVLALLTACGQEVAGPATTALELLTVTTGAPADPDGYVVRVDGSQGTPLGINAGVLLSDLVPGAHEVELRDVAHNCRVAEPNPRTVTAAAGATTRVRFDVACEAAGGALELAVTTVGESPDPDGYLVHLDGDAGTPVAASGVVRFEAVAGGEHAVLLTGLAPNCAVRDGNPLTFEVGVGTIRVEIEVQCAAPSGTIRVAVSTVGIHPDADGYVVSVGGEDHSIEPNGSVTLAAVPAGVVTVELGGVAANCTVDGDNPRQIPLGNGSLVLLSFVISCLPDRQGLVLFTSDRHGSFHLFSVHDDGTDVRDLTPATQIYAADWSPDGTMIVAADGEGLLLMHADGSAPTRLGVSGGTPRWSPDGRTIVFNNGGVLTLMNPDGTGVTPLVQGYDPAWSPDGSRIAFSRIDRSRCVATLFCPSDLYVMAADGTGVVRLVSAANASDVLTEPAWSPDGARIGYSRRCCFLGPNDSGVYVVSWRGGAPQRVYTGAVLGGPVWAPDGEAFALAIESPAGGTEMLLALAGGTGVPLASSPGSEYPQAWR